MIKSDLLLQNDRNEVCRLYTIFQQTKISEPALFSPSDAIYQETLSAIRERREEGCIAVEMECDSMLAAAKCRHIPFIQFLYGADNLGSDTWEIRNLNLYGLTNAERYMVLARAKLPGLYFLWKSLYPLLQNSLWI